MEGSQRPEPDNLLSSGKGVPITLSGKWRIGQSANSFPQLSEEPAATSDTKPTVDLKTFFLGGLFAILMAATLYVAKTVILPVVLALMLKFLFQPIIRFADKFGLPRLISALFATALLVAVLGIVAAILSGSASSWFSQLPQGLSKLEQKLSFLHTPISFLQQLNDTFQRIISGASAISNAPQQDQTSLPAAFLAGTGTLVDVFLSSLLLLLFLLAAGDTFLRRLVEVLPRFHDKRQAVDIFMQIERDIGTYLLTVTIMNFLVGAAMALGAYICGLNDPVLWGAVSLLLNYVPIVGPIAGFALFGIVGFLSFDNLGSACLPALIYLAIHVVEGEILTPLLLAKRLILNPAIIIISLIVWYGLWGVPGAFLAVPLLAITKIICGRIRPLMAFGHFLGD